MPDPAKSKQMSDRVSKALKGVPVIRLKAKISNISQKSPTTNAHKIIFATVLKDKSFGFKNQIKTRPSQKPPKICIGISNHQTL